jgi:hypothetical protein
VLLSGLALAEQGQTTPSFSKQQNRDDLAAIAAQMPSHCSAFLFSPVQGYGPAWKYQLDAMWVQLETGVPTLNGYSGNSPPGWALGDTNLRGPGDEYHLALQVNHWLRERQLDSAGVCWLKVGLQEGPYRARFVKQELPTSLTAGERGWGSVTYRNEGNEPWRVGEMFRLGSQAPRDNQRWGLNRVELPSEVLPGQEVTFRFSLLAPPAPGEYPFQWRMVREQHQWLGELSPLQTIQVQAAAPAATGP